MLDVASQQKFSRGCTDAGFGYAQAATAAYSQAATQCLEFWCQAFSGVMAGLDSAPASHTVPPAAVRTSELPFGLSPSDWLPFPFYDSRRIDAVMTADAPFNPMGVFLFMFCLVPLRGAPASWPFAQMMIDSGVPREVAWPTAEANAAVIDAAEVATQGFHKVLVACQTGSGFASSLPSAMLTPMPGAFGAYPMMAATAWPRLIN